MLPFVKIQFDVAVNPCENVSLSFFFFKFLVDVFVCINRFCAAIKSIKSIKSNEFDVVVRSCGTVATESTMVIMTLSLVRWPLDKFSSDSLKFG